MSSNNTPSNEQRNAPAKGSSMPFTADNGEPNTTGRSVAQSPAVALASAQGTTAAPKKDAPTDRFVLTNRGESTLAVPVKGPDGQSDVIFLQPGGKPKLPVGYVVDSVFLRRNPHVSPIKL